MTRSSLPFFWPEIRALLLAAMAIFAYTIGIGILNGTDLVDFDQRRILGHVHGGTLGWLTLAVFAAALWLFGEQRPVSSRERSLVRALCGLAVASFAAYVIAFSTTYGNARPILGTVSVLAIGGFFAWVFYRARMIDLSVPHWGFLAALGTSIVGGILGVLLGLEIATGDNYITEGGTAAHPATMVVGFLIPVALAMAEWALFFPHPPKASRAGTIQMAFPFLGGIVLMLALLLDIVPLAPVAVLLEFVGVGIFFKRMWPSFRALNLREISPGLHALVSSLSVVFVLGLAQYLIIRYEGDLDLAPVHNLLALDHAQFIGAMTNAVFAMLFATTVAPGQRTRPHMITFAIVNIGMAGFVLGLLLDVTVLKRIFAPIMGLGLLMGLAIYARALFEMVEPAARAVSSRRSSPSGTPGS